MKVFVLLFFVFPFGLMPNGKSSHLHDGLSLDQANGSALTIIYPKNNQKVRGEIKIYGKAKAGSVVKVQISSTYYKKAYKGENIAKGEGPLKRLNRTYSITANKQGVWMLDKIDLTNTGWEENFTIKASAEGETKLVNVYDYTHPQRID